MFQNEKTNQYKLLTGRLSQTCHVNPVQTFKENKNTKLNNVSGRATDGHHEQDNLNLRLASNTETKRTKLQLSLIL